MRIIACLAATLDGKIGSARNLRDRVGSPADLAHLLNVRNQADAILCGAETFRQHGSTRRGSQQAERAPWQCILTRGFDLPPEAGLFVRSTQADPPTPILIISPQEAPDTVKRRYPAHVEWLSTGNAPPVPQILARLAEKNIQTLMVEGGGHIVRLFLEARAIQEFYLTVCPLLLGGKDDPALVSAPEGFLVAEAPRTEVLSAEWRDQELYLHLRLHYPAL